MRILIPSQPIDPRSTHVCTLKHDIDLLRVEPALRVLVSVSLDADLLVYDHDFDVTISLFQFRDERCGLVFADVEEVVQPLAGGGAERLIHLVCDHFVGAALHGEEFALENDKWVSDGFDGE